MVTKAEQPPSFSVSQSSAQTQPNNHISLQAAEITIPV